jgi:uncharacterized membrane protein YhiD involved in acid resistance
MSLLMAALADGHSHLLEQPSRNSSSFVFGCHCRWVGFLGAGTILKLSNKMEVKGLTTASSVWLSAALGTAAGLAQYELATAAILVSLVVLAVLRPIDKWIARIHHTSLPQERTNDG